MAEELWMMRDQPKMMNHFAMVATPRSSPTAASGENEGLLPNIQNHIYPKIRIVLPPAAVGALAVLHQRSAAPTQYVRFKPRSDLAARRELLDRILAQTSRRLADKTGLLPTYTNHILNRMYGRPHEAVKPPAVVNHELRTLRMEEERGRRSARHSSSSWRDDPTSDLPGHHPQGPRLLLNRPNQIPPTARYSPPPSARHRSY
ncbi:hypothetical protein Q1695_014210 [Nippostrongylus brasiliensis]|nr:hypothetical protein Q1695_014210 [Nippostrongylus brasiliensis]